MNAQNLIACFSDTAERWQSPPLAEATRLAAESGRVYPENFRSFRLHPVWESQLCRSQG